MTYLWIVFCTAAEIIRVFCSQIAKIQFNKHKHMTSAKSSASSFFIVCSPFLLISSALLHKCIGLSLYCAHGDSADKVFLEEGESQNQRANCHQTGCHAQTVFRQLLIVGHSHAVGYFHV